MQMGIAFHSYHDVFNTFPKPAIVGLTVSSGLAGCPDTLILVSSTALTAGYLQLFPSRLARFLM